MTDKAKDAVVSGHPGPESDMYEGLKERRVQQNSAEEPVEYSTSDQENAKSKQKLQNLLLGSAKSATYNIFLQLGIRVMSFILNAIVLHQVSTDLLGVVNVRLTLLYSTTLFIGTGGFDQACLSKIDSKDWKQSVNLSWCTVPASIIVCTFFSLIWIFLLEAPDPDQIPYYYFGVFSFALSTVITCMARPHFVVAQAFMWVKLKVSAVAISELIRVLITAVLVIYFPSLGLISFSFAQILCALLYVVIYYVTFYVNRDNTQTVFFEMKDFFPQKPKGKPWLNKEEITLTKNFFKTSILKQMLTEGEKYIMTVFGVLNFSDQGVYDVINNLGSLVPRFVFQPLEESGYVLYSQTLKRGQKLSDQSKESVEMTSNVLKILFRTVTLIGCTILVFGQSYAHLFLDIYGGQKISGGSGPLLMKWYAFYVLFLAVNGVTECFYFATMSNEEIERYNKKLVVFSCVLLLSTLLFTNLFGSVGFILANCINMGSRILHSVWYIQKYFRNTNYHPLEGFYVSKAVILSLVASLFITKMSEAYFCCSFGILYRIVHIGIGAVCFFSVLLTMWLKEKKIWLYIIEQYKRKSS